MRKIKALLTVVFVSLGIISFGQSTQGKVNGTVVDGNRKTIESATITLRRAVDSSVVKMSVADKSGNLLFESISDGKYFVSIAAVGHQKRFTETFELDGSHHSVVLKTIELFPEAESIA